MDFAFLFALTFALFLWSLDFPVVFVYCLTFVAEQEGPFFSIFPFPSHLDFAFLTFCTLWNIVFYSLYRSPLFHFFCIFDLQNTYSSNIFQWLSAVNPHLNQEELLKVAIIQIAYPCRTHLTHIHKLVLL